MRILGLLIILAAVSSCATTIREPNSLHNYFDESRPTGGADHFRFFAGPWYAPGTSIAYQLTDDSLLVVENTDEGQVEMLIRARECPEIPAVFDSLKYALLETVESTLGGEELPLPEITVMDGPIYELEYHTIDIMGDISVSGGGTAEFIVPWLGRSLEVLQLSETCGDS